jgi:ubiquinone/menaquinone biosynthesis C-methylase UbiE
VHNIYPPVLVVGAGQGLIVGELQKKGLQCDGVDLSSEMIRYAKLRRGLDLVQADARSMPFGKGAYRTIIYATGVVDFMSDEDQIRVILNEARRIADHLGNIFVAFYKLSAATEDFVAKLGLLRNNVLLHRETLEIYQLNPVQAITWVAKRTKVGCSRAAILSLQSWAFSSWQEKRNAFCMQRIFARANRADTLIQAAPEKQAYRNEAEIRNLFTRLAIPIKQLGAFGSCCIVRI